MIIDISNQKFIINQLVPIYTNQEHLCNLNTISNSKNIIVAWRYTKYNTLIGDTKYNTLIGGTKYNTLPSYKVQYSVQLKEPKHYERMQYALVIQKDHFIFNTSTRHVYI